MVMLERYARKSRSVRRISGYETAMEKTSEQGEIGRDIFVQEEDLDSIGLRTLQTQSSIAEDAEVWPSNVLTGGKSISYFKTGMAAVRAGCAKRGQRATMSCLAEAGSFACGYLRRTGRRRCG